MEHDVVRCIVLLYVIKCNVSDMWWCSFSEPSVSGSVESHASPAAADDEADDVPADRSRMTQRIPSAQEEQPSTSSGVQIDRASQERHEVSQGLCDTLCMRIQCAAIIKTPLNKYHYFQYISIFFYEIFRDYSGHNFPLLL